MILSFIFLFFTNRRKITISILITAVFFGALGWLAIRNFTLLGFFALPILSYNFYNIFRQKKGETNYAKENGVAVLYIVLAALGFYGSIQYISAHGRESGIGLKPGVENAADFLRKEKIAGPLFNNYDFGGYLIWELFPGEKVFVDNRPAEYPGSFFSDVYKPMQETAAIFEKVDQEYNFNAVFFYRRDITPWGTNFLKVIEINPAWAKVFEDDYAVIFVKK
jgi:hypothetical protein